MGTWGFILFCSIYDLRQIFATYSYQETCLRLLIYYYKLVLDGFMVAVSGHPARIIKGLLLSLLLYLYKQGQWK